MNWAQYQKTQIFTFKILLKLEDFVVEQYLNIIYIIWDCDFFWHSWFLRLRETHNALQLSVFFFFLFSFQPYPKYREIRSKKLFYRPLNSQYNSVVCSCRKETFLVYCFSEQVARLIPYRLLHKYSHLFICMSIKETLSSGQKPVYTLKTKTSEQIAYAEVHYFGQVFVFSRLIDKSVLE